jgi:hypothetical protein
MLILLSCLAPAVRVSAQGQGPVVVGTVVNGTAGGIVPADIVVTLEVQPGDGATRTHTATAADGSFRFEQLELEDGDIVQAYVTYQDVIYRSDQATASQADVELTVLIYEWTDEPAGVEIAQLHVFIVPGETRPQVLEYYLLSNTSDRTYVGTEDAETGQRVTMAVPLPDGADDLRLEGSGGAERFLERGAGMLDTEPVRPGVATVETFLIYQLPAPPETSVRRTFDLPVQSVVLLVPQGELSLQGVGLEPGGVIDTQTGPALSYTAGPLAAGEPLVFEIVAGSEPGAPAPVIGAPVNRRPQQETALGLLALALAVVSVYVIWRRPSTPRPPVAARPLLARAAALDEQYEIGGVSEREYRRERKALIRRIRALVTDDSDG